MYKLILLISFLLLTGCDSKLKNAKIESMSEDICKDKQGVYKIRDIFIDIRIYCYDGSSHRVTMEDVSEYTNENLKNYMKDDK